MKALFGALQGGQGHLPRGRAFLALLAVVGFLPAAPAAATPLGAWEHSCVTDMEHDNQLCTTELFSESDGEEFLLYFAHNPNGTSPFVIEGPEHPFLRFSVSVDDKEPIETEACDIGLCYFGDKESAALLTAFQRGQKARVELFGAGQKRIFTKEITLLGFSAAFALYRP